MIYPPRCSICDKVLYTGNDEGICKDCGEGLEYVSEPYCMKCGKPVDVDEEFCVDCVNKRTSFEYGRAVFVYNKYMQKSMAGFKYCKRAEYGKFYASQIAKMYGKWIERISPDALIPVPVHEDRRMKRGYNQSEIIAEILGNKMGIKVISDLIFRTKNTLPQKELSDRERKSNLYNAFVVSEASRELYQNVKCVIIIDDIYTTGSTIEECSYILKSADIDKIYFICICIGKG